MREGHCECCGERTLLRPNRRPHVPLLDDEDLLRMIDREGEEATNIYHQAMVHLKDTLECNLCRSLDSTTYFIVLAGNEPPPYLYSALH